MPIVIKCPGCGKAYRLRDELAGKRVKCKCGHGMLVPAAPDGAGSDSYDLAPAGGSDESSLLNEGLPAAAEGVTPPGPAKRPSAAEPEAPAEAGLGKPDKKTQRDEMLAKWGPVAGLVGLTLLPIVVILIVVWLILRPGYGSPADAFAAHQQALLDRKWSKLIGTYTPQSQAMFVDRMLERISRGVEDKKWRVELEAALEKHGIAEILPPESPSEALAEAVEAAADAADQPEEQEIDYEEIARQANQREQEREARRRKLIASVEDKAALYVDLNGAIQAAVEKTLPENPMLAIQTKKPVGEARRYLARLKLDAEPKIDGKTAEGSLTFVPVLEEVEITVPVKFQKIDGRWYIDATGLEHYEDLTFQPLFGGGWL